MKKNILHLLIFTCLMFGVGNVWGQTYYNMSSGNKTWNFADMANWTNNFASGTDAANWRSVGIIGSGTSVTTGTRTTKSSATFVSSTTGGLQRGTEAMVFLSTGSSSTPEAVAVDLLLNFSGRTAGTLSFDWTALDNSSGTRPTSLRVFWTTDGTTFTEITGAQVLEQVSPSSGSITTVALPTEFNNSSTAVLRFYNHAGSITGSGSRDKMQIDNVAVTSTASASSSSNIIANTGFTYPANIDYTAYQGTTLTTGNSMEVGQFTIQDGGGSADADALTTQLTALTLSVANSSGLRRIALFDGSSNVAEAAGGSSATFTGLSLSAADDGSKTFSVRVSFLSSVTDNQQFSFTVNSATANSSGSTFAAANAGAAATSTTGDINRIEVTTADIIFDQNVSNVAENAVMSPSPTVRAVDDNVNFDLDNTSNVVMTVTTGSATFGGSATTTVAMVAGVATFSNLVFAAAANSNNLTATQGSFTDVSSSFNVTASAPEINVKQNVTNLASGSGSHAAGSVVSGNSGSAITFTIENSGSANLTYSSITNSNTTDFTLDLSGTSTPIVPSGTTTFTVTFNPTTAGAKSTTITINNNDADEGTYTFTVTGTGTVSSASNIITNSGYTYTSNVNYAGFQTASTLTVGNSVGVHGLIIQDGAGSADADNLGTTLTAISFTTGGSTAIRTAALFDGATNVSEVAVNGATTISFSSLTLSAADGSTKNFELRVTYQSTVTDNQQITFAVSSATASSTTSGFAAANAGAAASSTTSDINRLEVTADRLAWVQQPSSVNTGATMSPSPTISANDANSNRDLDYTSTVTLTPSASTISAGGSVAAVSGLATFSGLQFSSTGTGVTLSGADGLLTSTGNSSSFNITVQAPGLLLLEDNFTHSAILTSNGYTANSGTGTNNLTAGATGLTYTNYGSSNLGNALAVANNGQDVSRTFTTQNSPTTVYASFLVNVSAAQSGGDYIFAFAPSSSASEYRARTFIKASANSGFINFGISNNGTANYNSTPTNYAISTTHLVVVKYTFTSGSSATATVFINPNTSTEPSSGEVSFTDNTGSTAPADISSFTIRQGSSSLAPTLVLDGIRIATNWGALMGNPQYTSATDTIAEGNYNNVTVYNAASVTVSAGKTVRVNGNLTNNGSITLKASSASSYAQLMTTGTVSGSGTVTQERAITGSTNGWRFVSAPVAGGTLGNFGSNILINSSPPNNIITLNTANPNAWVGFHGMGGSTSTAIAAGKGYALYYGGSNGVNGSTVASTLSLTGNLSTSDVSVSGLSAGSVADIYGWSLVGNPYTCGINLSGLTRSNVNEAYYIWDVNKSGGAGFASYVGTTSSPSGALNGVIPPMQGFLVKATGLSPSLTIPRSACTVSTPNAQLRGTSSFTHRMYVRITEPQSGKWDETAVLSDPQATSLFEGSFDAYKLNSWDAQALNLATVSADNQRLSINTTGDWDALLQVPLQLTTTLNGPMQLTVDLSEVAAGQAVWLEDLHTGAYHDLRSGTYAFSHLSNVADRFRIHFRALSTSLSPDPLAGVQLFSHDGRVWVRGWDAAFALEAYDLQGRRVASGAFEAGMGSDGWFSGVSPGIYLVRCTTSEGAKSVKLRL